MSLPLRFAPLLQRLRAAAPSLVLLLICMHSVLASVTTELLGPFQWDEFKYVHHAINGEFDRGVRSRYAHIWLIRLFTQLIDDRKLAAGTYAMVVNTALLLVVYALGRRVLGAWGGVLSAFLAYTFVPLATFWTEPLADPPSTLFAGIVLLCALRHRDGGNVALWSLISGLAMFASLKSKETGITVAPVALWLMSERREELKRTFLYGAAGVLLGQGLLCAVDQAITGDAFQSLRTSIYKSYVGAISSKPAAYSTGRHLSRYEWVGQFLSRGIRELSLLGGLGLVLGFRRHRVMRALGLWAMFNLFFGAWVCWRYAGIDAVVRYLAPFAPALCVGGAYVIVSLWRAGLESGIPAWLRLPLVALACAVAALGMGREYLVISHQLRNTDPHLPARTLFDLAVPLALAAAALVHRRRLRLVPLVLLVVGLTLSGSLDTHRYLEKARSEQGQWVRLSRNIAQLGRYDLAILNVNPRHRHPLDTTSLVWKTTILGTLPVGKVQARRIERLEEARPNELVLVDFGTKRDVRFLHRFRPQAPFESVQWVSRGRLRTEVFKLPEGAIWPPPEEPAQDDSSPQPQPDAG